MQERNTGIEFVKIIMSDDQAAALPILNISENTVYYQAYIRHVLDRCWAILFHIFIAVA